MPPPVSSSSSSASSSSSLVAPCTTTTVPQRVSDSQYLKMMLDFQEQARQVGTPPRQHSMTGFSVEFSTTTAAAANNQQQPQQQQQHLVTSDCNLTLSKRDILLNNVLDLCSRPRVLLEAEEPYHVVHSNAAYAEAIQQGQGPSRMSDRQMMKSQQQQSS